MNSACDHSQGGTAAAGKGDVPAAVAVQAPTSCRTGRVVCFAGRNNQQVPVRLMVEAAMVGRTHVFTATGKSRRSHMPASGGGALA